MKNSETKNHLRKLRVGFFDSGHGGLGLLKEAMSRELNAEFLFVADLSNLPYGEKDEEFVRKRCLDLADFLYAENCDAIVVACNTATAIGIEAMRASTTIPIIGVEPYFNFINKGAHNATFRGPIAALVTPATFQSNRLKELQAKIDPAHSISVIPMPGLANEVETLILKRDEENFKVQLKALLSVVKPEFKTLLLGCTHYPLVASFIEEELEVKTICPTREVIDQLERILSQNFKELLVTSSVQSTFKYTSSEHSEWEQKFVEDFLFWS